MDPRSRVARYAGEVRRGVLLVVLVGMGLPACGLLSGLSDLDVGDVDAQAPDGQSDRNALNDAPGSNETGADVRVDAPSDVASDVAADGGADGGADAPVDAPGDGPKFRCGPNPPCGQNATCCFTNSYQCVNNCGGFAIECDYGTCGAGSVCCLELQKNTASCRPAQQCVISPPNVTQLCAPDASSPCPQNFSCMSSIVLSGYFVCK